jgi:hypothetical protein
MANPVWIDDFNKPLTSGPRTRAPKHSDRQRSNPNVRLEENPRRAKIRNGIEPVESVRYGKDK